MTALRPGPLPDYAWAGHEPPPFSEAPWRAELPPITEVTTDPARWPDSPPPVPGDLVPIAHPSIRCLAAYWHEGWPGAVPQMWCRPEVLDRLLRVVAHLPSGFGLAIWDAWRDPRLQQVLHDTVYQDPDLAPGFVAVPDHDPRRCPPHASGGTVDLTLTWQLQPLALGTGFDAFVATAAATALEPDGDQPSRDLRRLLAATMQSAGFVGHPQEWWHWEFGTRMWADVCGAPVRFGHTTPPERP